MNNLSEEEKKAIEWLKKADWFSARLYSGTILNLIEKQSKEIEELKNKNNINENYISKDKIKAKIEQFKFVRNTILETGAEYKTPMMTYDLIRNDYCEKMLQELLEEE